MKNNFLVLCLLPIFLLAACSDDKKDSKPSKEDGGQIVQNDANTLSVVDEGGRPIAGAKILIGTSLNVPFSGNFLTTNSSGQLQIPGEWTSAQPITVQAPGFVRMTQFARNPTGATFKLRASTKLPSVELHGTSTGHTVRDYDDIVDFGLVMSAITRNDVLALDLSKVISNQMDTMSVIGQALQIPSNITVPSQKETYWLPLTLAKPAYRLYFSDQGVQRVYAAAGKFPFHSVVDQLRNKAQFYDVINSFTIVSGVIRDVNVKNGTAMDLPVGEVPYNVQKTFKAPAITADQVLITMATADVDGWLVPTDVKRFTANQSISMSTMPGKSNFALGVLKNRSEFDANAGGSDRISATLLPFENGVTPQFLDLIPNPTVNSVTSLHLPRPSSLNGVYELATYALYSEVRQIPMGTATMPFLLRLWEVYAPQWVDGMEMPQWPEGTPEPEDKRWEVAYIGSQTKDTAELGQAVINAATHVTHSSLDF